MLESLFQQQNRHRIAIIAVGILIFIGTRSEFLWYAAARNTGVIAFHHAITLAKDVERRNLTLNTAISVLNNDPAAERWQGFALAAREDELAAIQMWMSVPEMENEALHWGERAWRANEMELAEQWFSRATVIAPGNGDGWYWLGLVRQRLDNPDGALDAFRTAKSLNNVAIVAQSDVLYQIATVLRRNWRDQPTLLESQELYRDALRLDDFSVGSHRVETQFGLAMLARDLGQAPEVYRPLFAAIVVENPQHIGARIMFGWAILEADLDYPEAREQLLIAQALEPERVETLWQLGELARVSDHKEDAVAAYEQILRIDPAHTQAKQRLETLGGTANP